MSESQNAGKISKVSSLNDIDTEVADILANNVALQQFESSSDSSSPSSAKSDSIENVATKKQLSDEIKQLNDENSNKKLENTTNNTHFEPFKLAEKKIEFEKEQSSITEPNFQQQFFNKHQSLLAVKSENISNIDTSATRSNNMIKSVDPYKHQFQSKLANVIISRDDSIEESPNSTISKSNLISLNSLYVKSFSGLLRFVLILFYLGSWISLASVSKSLHLGRLNSSELQISLSDGVNLFGYTNDIRSAFLFFTVTGFCGSIALFSIVAFNIHKYYNKLPWILFTFISNMLWIPPVFILSILSAVAESDLTELNKKLIDIYKYDLFKLNFNVGAYTSAAIFGFLCSIVLMIDSVLHALRLKGNLAINYP